MNYIIESFFIGMAVAAIFGPISVLFVQKTLKLGMKGSIAVGLATSLGDAVYGIIAGTGMSVILHFLMKQMALIKSAGGLFLIYLAIKEWFSKPVQLNMVDKNSSENLPRLFTQTFFLTLTGPVTVIFFTSVFASMGGRDIGLFETSLIVSGIFLGSLAWWIIFGTIVLLLRTRLSQVWLNRTRYFSSVIIGGFGLWTIGSAVLKC